MITYASVVTRAFVPVVAALTATAMLPGCGGTQTAGFPVGATAREPSTSPSRTGWISRAAPGQALLFVADQDNQRIDIFPQTGKNQKPIGRITDALNRPVGLFVDGNGTLYVCNFGLAFGTGTVTEYPKGHTTHSKTLTAAGSPENVVVGDDGTVYVSSFGGSSSGQVLEYARGRTTPTTTIAFPTAFPAGLALDSRNRLYVAFNDYSKNDIEVLRFYPGKTKGQNLGIHLKDGYAGGAAMDSQDNLLVVDQNLMVVDVFPPGAKAPSHRIMGFSLAYQIALNRRNGHLYVSQIYSVREVSYPDGKWIDTISRGLISASGVATSPDS